MAQLILLNAFQIVRRHISSLNQLHVLIFGQQALSPQCEPTRFVVLIEERFVVAVLDREDPIEEFTSTLTSCSVTTSTC